MFNRRERMRGHRASWLLVVVLICAVLAGCGTEKAYRLSRVSYYNYISGDEAQWAFFYTDSGLLEQVKQNTADREADIYFDYSERGELRQKVRTEGDGRIFRTEYHRSECETWTKAFTYNLQGRLEEYVTRDYDETHLLSEWRISAEDANSRTIEYDYGEDWETEGVWITVREQGCRLRSEYWKYVRDGKEKPVRLDKYELVDGDWQETWECLVIEYDAAGNRVGVACYRGSELQYLFTMEYEVWVP